MQTEVPTLPIVYSDGDKHLTRKVKKGVNGVSPTESKNHTQCNYTTPFLVFNRKQLNPILGGPYKDSMRVHCQSEPARVTGACKHLLGQRIISAKVLRVKELQNQLSDAHYHLNELANENRLLKALQKRQDSALKRYEGTNAELPRIINSHQEELKALQTKYKQLKFQHKHTCDLLKEKESEIHSLQSQNKHLLKLSKDQQLGEREKLQIQVSDLNHEIEEHHKTIQTLNRKLTLESKKFKHQINTEVTKHRDTRKQLYISLEKLKSLEELLNNREKRLYSNPNSHQLPSFNRRQPTTSQSLTNLRNNSVPSHFVKSANTAQNSHGDVKNETLPKLNMKESNDGGKLSIIRTNNTLDTVNTSETMTSLDHVRKFRLQKSAQSRHSSPYTSDENEIKNKFDVETNFAINNSKINSLRKPIATKNTHDDKVMLQKMADNELRDVNNEFVRPAMNITREYHTPEKLMREFGFLSSNSDASDDDSHTDSESISPTCKSKYLHDRLINAPVNDTSTKKSSLPRNSSEKYDNKRLSDQNNVNDDENTSLTEMLSPDTCEISSHSSKVKPPNDSDIKNNRMTPQQNLINNSCDKFDASNENGSFTNGQDLWTRLRGQLNRVHENILASPQSTVDSIDAFAMKNTLSSTSEGERKSSLESDELLHYFDAEKHNEVFDKLSMSDNNDRYSQIPITNGLNSNVENNVDIKDDNSLNTCDVVSKANVNDASNKKENGVYLSAEENENSLAVLSSDISKTLTFTSSQELPSDTNTINFNKQKLLAAMKAIDNNENIEFTSEKKVRETNNSIRSQVTENLYRGLPTHTKKRDDIIKDIFADTKIEGKLHSGCSKLH